LKAPTARFAATSISLASSTALAGGVVRDALIGAVPPETIRDWCYAATAFAVALVTFFFYPYVEAFSGSVMMLLHAAGLALFALAGTEKAIDHKIHPFMAVLVGAVILIVIRRLGISATLAAIAGGVCCFVLRVVAGYSHWNLPRIANP